MIPDSARADRRRTLALQLIAFLVLGYATVLAFPHLVTQRHFAPGDPVPSLFPIAIRQDGHPAIVTWSDYRANPAAFADALVRAPLDGRNPLTGDEHLTLDSAVDGTLTLELHTDDYTFCARYAIEPDRVRPLSLRHSGPFVVFWAAGVGELVALAVGWWRRRRLPN